MEYPRRKVIRYQFRRTGRVHRAEVSESLNSNREINVSHPYRTLCGKSINIGWGGWGYGQPDCEDCLAVLEARKSVEASWQE